MANHVNKLYHSQTLFTIVGTTSISGDHCVTGAGREGPAASLPPPPPPPPPPFFPWAPSIQKREERERERRSLFPGPFTVCGREGGGGEGGRIGAAVFGDVGWLGAPSLSLSLSLSLPLSFLPLFNTKHFFSASADVRILLTLFTARHFP